MHREEQTFTIELHVVAEFGDDYEGDEDGYAWLRHFEEGLKPNVIAALLHAVQRDEAFTMRAAPRGKDPDRSLELELRYRAGT